MALSLLTHMSDNLGLCWASFTLLICPGSQLVIIGAFGAIAACTTGAFPTSNFVPACIARCGVGGQKTQCFDSSTIWQGRDHNG